MTYAGTRRIIDVDSRVIGVDGSLEDAAGADYPYPEGAPTR